MKFQKPTLTSLANKLDTTRQYKQILSSWVQNFVVKKLKLLLRHYHEYQQYYHRNFEDEINQKLENLTIFRQNNIATLYLLWITALSLKILSERFFLKHYYLAKIN